MKQKLGRGMITVISMLLVFAFLTTGCAGSSTVATLDGEKIPYDLAYLIARYRQATYDNMYLSYFGTEMWQQDSGNDDGTTIEDAVKDEILDEIEELYLVKNHAEDYDVSLTKEEKQEIEEVADEFMSDNSDQEDGLEEIGASKELVVEMLELYKIHDKVYEAVTKDVDTTVTEEEMNQAKINYVIFNTATKSDDDGNDVELTEEEAAEVVTQAEDFATGAQAAEDFTTYAEGQDLTASIAYYGADDESLPDVVKEAADALEEGAVSEPITSETNIYVVQLVSKVDEEATATKKEDVITTRKSDKYTELLDGWKEDASFKVNKSVWNKVSFARLFAVVTGATATGDATASGDATTE